MDLFVLLVFNAITTVFQLYTVLDEEEKAQPTRLLNQWIFNYIGMVREDMAFANNSIVSYSLCGKWIERHLNVTAVIGFIPLSVGSPALCFNQLSHLLPLPCIWISVELCTELCCTLCKVVWGLRPVWHAREQQDLIVDWLFVGVLHPGNI